MHSVTATIPQDMHGLEMPIGHKLCNTIDESGKGKCADIIYFKNGTLIQRIGEYTVTGQEEWFFDENDCTFYFFCPHKFYDDSPMGGHEDTMMCTHFRWISEIGKTKHGEFRGGDKNEVKFNYYDGVVGTEKFKMWLRAQLSSKIPVKIFFILDKPIVKHLSADYCLEYYIYERMEF